MFGASSQCHGFLKPHSRYTHTKRFNMHARIVREHASHTYQERKGKKSRQRLRTHMPTMFGVLSMYARYARSLSTTQGACKSQEQVRSKRSGAEKRRRAPVDSRSHWFSDTVRTSNSWHNIHVAAALDRAVVRCSWHDTMRRRSTFLEPRIILGHAARWGWVRAA